MPQPDFNPSSQLICTSCDKMTSDMAPDGGWLCRCLCRCQRALHPPTSSLPFLSLFPPQENFSRDTQHARHGRDNRAGENSFKKLGLLPCIAGFQALSLVSTPTCFLRRQDQSLPAFSHIDCPSQRFHHNCFPIFFPQYLLTSKISPCCLLFHFFLPSGGC